MGPGAGAVDPGGPGGGAVDPGGLYWIIFTQSASKLNIIQSCAERNNIYMK